MLFVTTMMDDVVIQFIQEIPMKMSQGGDSDDHDHHRARMRSKDEVVKIRVKDLKNIKARLLVMTFVSENVKELSSFK